jgi:hypothetical protein
MTGDGDRAAEQQHAAGVGRPPKNPTRVVILGFVGSAHADASRNKELFGFLWERMLEPAESRTVTRSVPAQVINGAQHCQQAGGRGGF